MKHEDLNLWAEKFERKYGHVPIIIGLEYEDSGGEWLKVVDANNVDPNVTVEDRFANRKVCNKQQLFWKRPKYD